MKKRAKSKSSQSSSGKSKAAEPKLPDLVTAMMKLVERLEFLERKMDQVAGRVSNFPSDVRRAVQELQRSQPSSHAPAASPQNHGVRERTVYKAVCADCCKNCEVPFRPIEGRPVYCPECWAIRKAGHVPKDPTANVIVPPHVKELKTPPPVVKEKNKNRNRNKNRNWPKRKNKGQGQRTQKSVKEQTCSI